MSKKAPAMTRRDVLRAIEEIAKKVGEQICLIKPGDVWEIGNNHGHESSTIDRNARDLILNYCDDLLPKMQECLIRLESDPFRKNSVEVENDENTLTGALIIDELDGTTNTKRRLKSTLSYEPQAGISIAWSLSESLKDLQCSCFFTLNGGDCFSAMKSEESFISFVNKTRLDPQDVTRSIVQEHGDSKYRVLVIGYSNGNRIQKGHLEQAIYDAGMMPYGDGSRSSGIDIINVIRGQYDAYVDFRAIWSQGDDSQAQLQVYDCAGIVPVAIGAGLIATDHKGEAWDNYNPMGSLPLVVSRPEIHKKILDAVQNLYKE